MKVYIVRATSGIGIIYGVFDTHEGAEQYASNANVAIESYNVSRRRPKEPETFDSVAEELKASDQRTEDRG